MYILPHLNYLCHPTSGILSRESSSEKITHIENLVILPLAGHVIGSTKERADRDGYAPQNELLKPRPSTGTGFQPAQLCRQTTCSSKAETECSVVDNHLWAKLTAWSLRPSLLMPTKRLSQAYTCLELVNYQCRESRK